MEKSTDQYHFPGEMFKLLRETALGSIRNDFNMIIEEYGFWEKLPTKDRTFIVQELFSHVLIQLQPLIVDCEASFVSNFIVSFAYRKLHAGQIVQYGGQESTDMYIVWDGAVAVCEMTEFNEPILVYPKGTAINIYQILMETELPFDYRAVGDDEFIEEDDQECVNFHKLHAQRKEKIYFNEHRFKPWQFEAEKKDVQLYAVEADRLQELLEVNPKAEEIFLDYAHKQTDFLRKTRVLGHHLLDPHRNGETFIQKGTKRQPIFLNKEIEKDELDFEVKDAREETAEEQIYDLVTKVNKKMDILQRSMDKSHDRKSKKKISDIHSNHAQTFHKYMSKKFARSDSCSNIFGDSTYLSEIHNSKEADQIELLEGDDTPVTVPKLEKASESAPAHLASAGSFADLCNSQLHANTSSSFDDSIASPKQKVTSSKTPDKIS